MVEMEDIKKGSKRDKVHLISARLSTEEWEFLQAHAVCPSRFIRAALKELMDKHKEKPVVSDVV